MLDLSAIVAQIDAFFSQNRGKDAEELLKKSMVQAMQEEDDTALLTLLNELIGYYRETSRVEESYQLADQAMGLMERMGLEGTLPFATTLLNIANAYRAGGRLDDSLKCYEKTMEVYRRLLDPKDMLVASLFNNMSLLYQEMGGFSKAKQCLLEALQIVSYQEEAYFELAVTYTNLASTCLSLQEDEEAAQYFSKAIALFEKHQIEDAHYSAALSALGTYEYKRGNFREAAKHFRKAMACMKRSLGENEYYARLRENLEACECLEAEEERQPQEWKGLALSKAYFEAYGKPMLEERFPEYLDQIAVGLVGEGSDCFGLDDEISRDHDWGPAFCLWITEELQERIGVKLQEAYEELPDHFCGYHRAKVTHGSRRRGVFTINSFYGMLLGERDWEKGGPLEETFWRQVPDASLAAATNGQVFSDPKGIFSAVRNVLKNGYPQAIQYLKLAQSAALFSQTGQYNYARMQQRGDKVTARILLGDCMREAMKLCYYMENQYPPHDKWLLQGVKSLEAGKELAEFLNKVVDVEEESSSQAVTEVIEVIATLLAKRLYRAGYISDTDPYLDAHTGELLQKSQYSVMTQKELAEAITRLEFSAFDRVKNVDGRASCQDDWFTFSIMRKSQYLTWDRSMLMQYLYDFQREFNKGHNLIEEKYGRMMESTDPKEYERMKHHFPTVNEQKKAIIEAIVRMQVGWMEEFEKQYPVLAGNARSIHTREDSRYNTSYETYLRGEISTYSDKMLELYGRYVVEYASCNKNLAYHIMQNSVGMYGYSGLEEAEKQLKRLAID